MQWNCSDVNEVAEVLGKNYYLGSNVERCVTCLTFLETSLKLSFKADWSCTILPRLRVVSNFGDRDCGAGEIHTRTRAKFRGDVTRWLALPSRRVSSKFRARVCVYFACPTIAIAKIRGYSQSRFYHISCGSWTEQVCNPFAQRRHHVSTCACFIELKTEFELEQAISMQLRNKIWRSSLLWGTWEFTTLVC